MKTRWSLFLVFIILSAVGLSACEVDDSAFSRLYRGDGNINLDLNDYGRIHVDAQISSCAQSALYALHNKVEDSLRYPNAFKRWLDGYNVAYIFAAAQQIGYHGWATKDLDFVLDQVAARYTEGVDPGGPCNKNSWNGCMDEESGAAAAYAWIAAYQFRRGDPSTSVTASVTKAKAKITSSFNAVCFHNPTTYTSGSPCNGTLQQLKDGDAKTMAVNHGQQTIPYGFGLLTGIASAMVGLESANVGISLTSDEKVIARKLFEEAQEHVDAGGNFTNDCAQPVNGAISWIAACGENAYHPYMYRLDAFFNEYVGSPPTLGTYRSNYFQSSRFGLAPSDNGFFSFGRYVMYYTHGYRWMGIAPKLLPFDRNNPIGYFDLITATGTAQGWTCDKDMPTGRIAVDFQVGGITAVTSDGWANDSSEAAINELCGGGSAHRFYVQLPSWTKGQPVKAFGLDYTWFGFTELVCLQSGGCSW